MAKNDPTSSSNATDALMGATGATEKSVDQILGRSREDIEAEILQTNLAAAKINLEAAKRAAAAQNSPAAETDIELKQTQLQTARLDMVMAQERNAQIIETREERIRRRKAALRAMEEEEETKQNIRASCAHRVGGFGLADAYVGGGDSAPTSIVCSTLPIMGMELFYCTRCGDETITPDRNKLNEDHEHYNPEQYAHDLEKFVKFQKLFRSSYNAKVMGGPVFQFNDRATGLPVHPTII